MNKFDRNLKAIGTPTYDFIQSIKSQLGIAKAQDLTNDEEIIYELCEELDLNQEQLVHLFTEKLHRLAEKEKDPFHKPEVSEVQK